MSKQIEKVEVFTKAVGCMQCKMAKRHLDENNVKYNEKDVADPEVNAYLKSIGIQTAPVIKVTYTDGEDRFVLGFAPDELAKIEAEFNDSSLIDIENNNAAM